MWDPPPPPVPDQNGVIETRIIRLSSRDFVGRLVCHLLYQPRHLQKYGAQDRQDKNAQILQEEKGTHETSRENTSESKRSKD